MDEASSLVTELQQKLAQLDHKIWLYQQDMASEFKKYADELLRDVPGEVSETVNTAIAKLLMSYPSLDVGSQDADTMGTNTSVAPRPLMPHLGLDSPTEAPQNAHEREQEFQGLFTPSYLPLLDSTDRNERKSSPIILSSASGSKAIGILERKGESEDTGVTSSSYPSSTLLSLGSPLKPRRRRNTDEASSNSDQSDTPLRRSALRQNSISMKPQSPRHVRFEFAGEEFPTTSSPKFESFALEAIEKVPIILGKREDTDYGTISLEEEIPESSSRKRVSSSEALRLLSRGPIEDDGTQWTEVRAPLDGSASVPKIGVDIEDGEDEEGEEDEESLTMRVLSVREVASRLNGRERRNTDRGKAVTIDDLPPLTKAISQHTEKTDPARNGDSTIFDVVEEEALANLEPLQPMKSHKPVTTISAAELESKYADKSKTVATKFPGKPWFTLADGADPGDFPESEVKFQVNDGGDDDDNELFAFDENTERPEQKEEPDPESEPESSASDLAEEVLVSVSQYATSPARAIFRPGIPSTSMVTTAAPPTSHRSSYHPFNTPIVSEAIHAQAASLGDVNTFVGSVKDGLDEDALQSFRAVAGSLRGGAPRSLTERLAFEDAMEAQREAAKKGRGS